MFSLSEHNESMNEINKASEYILERYTPFYKKLLVNNKVELAAALKNKFDEMNERLRTMTTVTPSDGSPFLTEEAAQSMKKLQQEIRDILDERVTSVAHGAMSTFQDSTNLTLPSTKEDEHYSIGGQTAAVLITCLMVVGVFAVGFSLEKRACQMFLMLALPLVLFFSTFILELSGLDIVMK